MADQQTDPKPTIVPKTPKGAAVVSGLGATILAGIGWIAQEFIDLETRVERVERNYEHSLVKINDDLEKIDVNQRLFRERMLVIERHVLKGVDE